MRRRVRPHAGTTPQVRYATPADVFPSTRPRGSPDTVIERFDILAQQMKERGMAYRG